MVHEPDAIIVSIQVGKIQDMNYEAEDNPEYRAWQSAIFKTPVQGPAYVGELGLEGDDQADKYHHGGPEQAVMLYSADHYSFWKQDLEIPDLPFGAFGENITVSVLNETNVHELDTYQIGDVLLQVTRLRQPCWKQERRLERPGLIKKIVNKGWSGWYHKVLVPGYIEAGMSVKLVDRVPNSVPLV